MITPEIGKRYVIKHSSGNVPARCLNVEHKEGFKSPHSSYRRSAITRYYFYNERTMRNVMLKSRVKILRQIED